MKIIGLGHYSRTGKDTFANAVVAWFRANSKLSAKKIPFAWKLKQICHDLYAWDGMREPEFYDTLDGEKFRDIKLPTVGKTPVEIWVAMGTPAIREKVYERTWIDFLLKSDHQCDVLVVPDVRFPNETSAILDAGGTLHKVVRPGYGPRNTVADRALLGYKGWNYIWGAHGDIDRLRVEAYSVAAAVDGLSEWPVQTEEDRRAALAVEKLPRATDEQLADALKLLRSTLPFVQPAPGSYSGSPAACLHQQLIDFLERAA